MKTKVYPNQTLGVFNWEDLMHDIKISDLHMDGMIFNAACNYWGCLSDCGIEVEVSKKAYAEAKKSVLELNPNPCIEEIYMQVLYDGGVWLIWDRENDELISEMTIGQMRHNLQTKLDRQVYLTYLEGGDDSLTANSVLQIAFFGEEVYG